ncbi:bromodomain and WD repeat-containing protein 1 [Impatiens glandulifera]|uniref:bromodomain and WD repeat-containing protein 1 n=1 Tax=Impatiens glandulifera TaxID=253017 RepID=UPI001FB0AF9C|nr:bromodomain and WD repeat-containing protein 1 [Impatiens glandulifera]XP_047310638.1 bromodomain and WD repeat-containing protein 1 [Impatiens glandulifera]
MALQKFVPSHNVPPIKLKQATLSKKGIEKVQVTNSDRSPMEADVPVDLREVYFLIMHFLSDGPCKRTCGQFWNELLEHKLLPRRYHAWYSRSGAPSGDENDDGISFPLSYNKLAERYPHIRSDHLVKLLKQLISTTISPSQGLGVRSSSNAATVPTLLGSGPFSLIGDQPKVDDEAKFPPASLRWPHMKADQVRGLSLREISGGFARHHRAPSIRAAIYAIAKPSTMVQKMQNIKKLRGHVNAVYCATFDRSGRYVVTGSDDRLVKIWSMETAYCLASCRGHEGDITDLAVSSNNTLVASASNDFSIRIWRLPDGLPISVLRGHTGAVTAIAFSPRPSSAFHLLSSSDDGSCRIWDTRFSQINPRIYVPRPPDSSAGAARSNAPSSSSGQQKHQIFSCAFNASGTVFVTGSSDTLARVWSTCKSNTDESEPYHEMDILAGHENDVNYVQFSGCAVASKVCAADYLKEDNVPRFRNTWLNHDNIVTCSRDGSAIIWIPRSRRSHGKTGRWIRAYHLKVPPPPMPPQPPRGGPRQRILPTPRGVNMIIWSLDNRFVLAAIMDCRICVWNAIDGSLVHSLTGHSESTYVLDVHPFNPRIAMSAGYDGKTIVWDIWEGKPIRIYEIGPFKLVDGKFSPDGTSIILSDDVGQLYTLTTGQGESQRDAMYDQFFLGDYRPLTQDTHGNVVDQETQLVPYRRNMQDLLCDARMIPYPEPYQSLYQKRRLGALGIEWRPSSVRFAVGPEMNQDQGYQMPVLDLDLLLANQMPEFLDPVEWEPEIDVQTEDTDSEYNVTEEFSSGGGQGSLASNQFDDPECSEDDSSNEGTSRDGIRRSGRRKPKAEAEIMTSSGRRVKRRNLDDYEDEPVKINRNRKSSGKKSSRRKSSSSKSLRPQRAAARNALNLFSRITGGVSTDGDDDDDEEEESMEGDSSSESDASLGDLGNDEESGESLPNDLCKDLKGKEVCSYDSENVNKHGEHSTSHKNTSTRKKLVLKIPINDSNKASLADKAKFEHDNGTDPVSLSSGAPHETSNGKKIFVHDPEYPVDPNFSEAKISRREDLLKSNHHFDLFEGYDGKARWGGSKVRTSKRMKMEGSFTSLQNAQDSNSDKAKDISNDLPTSQMDSCGVPINMEAENHIGQTEDKLQSCGSGYDKVPSDTMSLRLINNASDLKDNLTPISTKLRIKLGQSSNDGENSSYIRVQSSTIDDTRNGECHPPPDSSLLVEKDTRHEALQKTISNDRIFNVVYRRSKTAKSKNDLQTKNGSTEATTSNANGSCHESGMDHSEPASASAGVCQTRSMGLRTTAIDVNVPSDVKLDDSEDASFSGKSSSGDTCDEHKSEEWGSSTKITTAGLRSRRKRRGSYHFGDSSPPDRRKIHQPAKSSWLMLSAFGDLRYIPQNGDDVAYFRQGHEDYISQTGARDAAPWKTIKGDVRAVEFCKVIGLEYSTRPGSGESCCKMRVQFVDPSSSVAGKCFSLTLPELTETSDFLVERSKYESAVERTWSCRDRCQVWWKNDDSDEGSWWNGRIVSVKPRSPQFPDSPWEMYGVRYSSDSNVHFHSPWEFRDHKSQWEPPHIDNEIRSKFLNSLGKLIELGKRSKDTYGIQKLKQMTQKTNFINRFPVPLSLEVIQSRLENNYYRRIESLKHDIEEMLRNYESYFVKNAEISTKVRRLSGWFERTLLSSENNNGGHDEDDR